MLWFLSLVSWKDISIRAVSLFFHPPPSLFSRLYSPKQHPLSSFPPPFHSLLLATIFMNRADGSDKIVLISYQIVTYFNQYHHYVSVISSLLLFPCDFKLFLFPTEKQSRRLTVLFSYHRQTKARHCHPPLSSLSFLPSFDWRFLLSHDTTFSLYLFFWGSFVYIYTGAASLPPSLSSFFLSVHISPFSSYRETYKKAGK